VKLLKTITKYNLFIFFTTFARILVEVFIPLVLYNQGFELQYILKFLLISFGFNIILSSLISELGRKTNFNWIAYLSAFLFVGMYYLLLQKPNIYILALLYSANTSCYYIAKHNFAMSAIDSKVGSRVGGFMIAGMLAGIPAGYIGAVFLNKFPVWLIILLVSLIYLFGIIPLRKIKIKGHKNENVFKTLIKIPKRNLIFFAFAQFKVVLFFLFPLYVFVEIEKRYDFIGLLGIIVGIASMIFVYFQSRFMDKKKKDYMLVAACFLSLVMFIQTMYGTALLLLFTAFFEGIATKMYEMGVSKDFYHIPKQMDNACYFEVFEVLNNLIKFLIITVIFLLGLNLFTTIMVLIAGVLISGFIKFKIPE